MNKERKRILWQAALFIATFITTTLAGTEWVYGVRVYAFYEDGSIGFNTSYSWNDFAHGLSFSIPLILILTVHEFGHYFMALFHKVKTSLPYYIPIPPIPILPFSIGTMGAVIRLRSRPKTNVENFDIGLAGPVAGFVVALAVMIYGFSTLPPADYIFQFHAEYEKYGADYADVVYTEEYMKEQPGTVGILIGKNLLFLLFEQFVDPSQVPNAHELMHYPVLLAAYIALFFTCLNLLPIGQLDGGHVVYGLFGFRKHKAIATIFFVCLIFYSGLGLPFIDRGLPFGTYMISMGAYILYLYLCFSGLRRSKRDTLMYTLGMFAVQYLLFHFFPFIQGYTGWLLFGLLLGRVIGIEHPRSDIEIPLDSKRIILGWIALLIFVLCFSPAPLELEVY